jgi:uncharacterized protein (DUF1778 family)
MRRKTARAVGLHIRLHPEERDALRLNAGLQGMTVSDYIRQTCLGVRLRKTPEEKKRLRELARIGANINQLAKWANTYKRAVETAEVLTALAGIERRIVEFMTSGMAEKAAEDEPCS